MVKYHANNDNDNRGVPRIWQGGGPRFFFPDLEILHVAKRHPAYGEAMRFARGFGSMLRVLLPQEFFLNGTIWCVLVYIWIRFSL